MNAISHLTDTNQKINHCLSTICYTYISVIIIIFASITITCLNTEEDITLILDDFSISISSDPQDKYPIYLTGLVPASAKDIFSFSSNLTFKINLSQKLSHALGEKQKIRINAENISTHHIKGQEKSPYSSQYLKNLKIIKPIKMDLLTAHLPAHDTAGDDVYAALSKLPAEELSNSIEKVRIVLGETTLFQYWLNKIFNKSPLFKKTGFLIN